MSAAGGELVRLFECEPDLLRHLTPSDAAIARREVVVRVITLERGEWHPPLVSIGRGDLGFMVLDGAILRRIAVAGRVGVELLGAGDVVRPWADGEGSTSLPTWPTVRVCDPARVALLDHEFLRSVARWPEIIPEIVERATSRCTILALQLALAQLPRLEARILGVLWLLADRWGRVGPGGVTLPIALSQQTLAEMTAARRPSVNTALHRLMARGLIDRPGKAGVYRLKGAPPRDGTADVIGAVQPQVHVAVSGA